MPVPPALSLALSQLAEKDLDAVADFVSEPSRHEMVVDVGFHPVGKELKKSVGNVSRGAYAVPLRLTETPGGMGPLAMAVLVERLVERSTGEDFQKWSYPFAAGARLTAAGMPCVYASVLSLKTRR